MANSNEKIFSLTRLKFSELWEDAKNWIKKTYNATDEQFTMASAFAQLLSVILHMSKMIFYYIEDSITGLNIKTAYRPDLIRGIARMTGHDSGRAISARGAIKITYINDGNQDLTGKVCYIPNKTVLQSTVNGESYIVLFNADTAKITMTAGNYVDANIIQGTIKYQKATGTGEPLQSYNFTERNYNEIEQYFINIYINNERWDVVDSLLDLGYNQKGVMIKTGQTGGIDIFFGNGDMGMIPDEGSIILCEYIVTDGITGNLSKDYMNTTSLAWKFTGTGILTDGSTISLNENFRVDAITDIIFGANSEDITLTLLIAPHTSRSYVLANETNYNYFFKKMNMFSTIEIVKGYASKEANAQANILYDRANLNYSSAFDKWQEAVNLYGESSNQAQELYDTVLQCLDALTVAQLKVEDTNMNDNTVYIMLIPDISKRISSTVNYFTCDESLFTLSDEEQYNLLQMIENSGQKIITMENRILTPKTPHFAINANVKLWDGYSLSSVYSNALDLLSNYFINNTRKDLIPVSDITALLESVEGIDSVKVWFDADVANSLIYGKDDYYGIDDFGDVVLTRTYVNSTGNTREVRDILPLFRGGFTSPSGIEYSETLSNEFTSAFNLNFISYTTNTRLSLDNPIN